MFSLSAAARGAVCFLALLVVGCAEERDPINRVQAGAMAKSFFVGVLHDAADDPEFFMRTTVVDVAYGAGSDGLITSTDAQPTTRIRWEITENVLIARLTYERIDNSGEPGAKPTTEGQIVAGFPIDKHFDIRRDYNPSTGEELNVIVENSTDRPWYDREYFRVDWSRNLVTDAYDLDTLSQIGMWYAVTWSPLAYHVSDPHHPDAPRFEVSEGYFDLTTKALASPEIIEDEWWGDFPACWLYGYWPASNCNATEVTLRHSFLRVTDRDYEPVEWDGTKMDLFGLFTNDRFGYDPKYGVVDDHWHRFGSRWNLFEASHVDQPCATSETTPVGADVHRDDDGDGTEDECAAVGRGSRCDALVGRCTIPLRDRTLRTIAWHVNPGFPSELFEVSAQVVKAWSDAVRVGVVAGRLAECRRTGEANCEGQHGWPVPWTDDWAPPVGAGPGEAAEIFVLCHNPVEVGDAPSCRAEGTAPRLGDLRFNFLNILQEPEFMSPWGIMVDAEDPLSGEKIAGSVNVWGAVTDRHAADLADLVMLINGHVDATTYIEGQNVTDWVEAHQPGASTKGAAMSAAELARRYDAFDPQVLAPYLDGLAHDPKVPPPLRHKMRAKALVDQGRLGPGNAALSQRLRALQGTAIEAAMIDPHLAQLAGADPSLPPSPDVIERASPFGRNNPAVRRALSRQRQLATAKRHACRLEAAEPDNLLGLARRASVLFGAPNAADPASVQEYREKLFQWARAEYTKGVLAHEMGHAMGLRHNFAASFDALNYDPQYWQLRTGDGTVNVACEEGTTDGSACIGPRWRDPISPLEIDNDIQRFSTTSVMDYPGEPAQDQRLLGKYDRAAMRLVYGGVVDVWAEPEVTVLGTGAGRDRAYLLTAFTSNPGLTGVYYFPPVDPNAAWIFMHYSDYQKRFALIRDCQPSDAPDAVLGTRCREQALDVVDYRDMKPFVVYPEYEAFSWAAQPRAIDPAGRVRRGYLFSSDEYADAGNVPTFTGDSGADAYEIVRFLESQYEHRYLLDAFRRNRLTFNSWDVSWRMQYAYFDKIQQIAKTFAFGALLDGDPTMPSDDLLHDGYYGPLNLASTVALDLFARIMTRPEPGYYCPAEFCFGVQPHGVDSEIYTADWAPLPDLYLYDFRVALGDGRYLHNDYDYSQGYWWGEYQTQVGAFYDKMWATYYLAEAFDYFISNAKEDFTDSRYKNVNFATVYPEQVRRLYNNLLTGDYDVYAPWVTPSPNPSDTPLEAIQYPTWSDRNGLGPFPPGGLVLDPNHAWNQQVWAMVFGAMFFPTNWSQAWVHDARIALFPSEQPNWAPDEIVEFYHPASGLTYRARSSGKEELFGLMRERSAGARMLEWANRLVTVAYLVELDPNGDPLHDPFGKPILLLDGNGKPQPNPASPGAILTLQRYVDNIDQFRQLVSTFALPFDELPQP
jgi:hypothetical protein